MLPGLLLPPALVSLPVPLASAAPWIGAAAGAALALLLGLVVRSAVAQQALRFDLQRLRDEQQRAAAGLVARVGDLARRAEELEQHLPRLAELEPGLARVAADARALLERLGVFEAQLAAERQARTDLQAGTVEARAHDGAELRALLGRVGAQGQSLAALSDALEALRLEHAAALRSLAARDADLERRLSAVPAPSAALPAPAGRAAPVVSAPRAAPLRPLPPALPHFVAPVRPVTAAVPAANAPPAPQGAAPGAPRGPGVVRLLLAALLGATGLALLVAFAVLSMA